MFVAALAIFFFVYSQSTESVEHICEAADYDSYSYQLCVKRVEPEVNSAHLRVVVIFALIYLIIAMIIPGRGWTAVNGPIALVAIGLLIASLVMITTFASTGSIASDGNNMVIGLIIAFFIIVIIATRCRDCCGCGCWGPNNRFNHNRISIDTDPDLNDE